MDAIFGNQDITALQECARAALVFFYGLVMLRLSGRRTFAQMSAVDLVISIIIGSNLSRAMTGGAPFWGTLASVALLVALHLLLVHALARHDMLARWVEGRPILLARDGRVDEQARRRCKISHADIEEALRGHGLDGMAEADKVAKLVLEPSGKISVIRRQDPIRTSSP